MKGMLKRLIPYMELKSLNVEERITYLFLLTGYVLSGVAVITTFMFNSPFLHNLPNIIVFTLCYSIPLLFKNNFVRATRGALYLVGTVYFPILYFFNAGINGAIPLYIVMIVIYFSFSVKGKRLFIVIGSLILYYSAFLIFAFHFDHWVTPYPDRMTQLTDMIIAITSIIVVLTLMARTIFNEYRKENERAEELLKSIEESNRKLSLINIKDQLTGAYNRNYFFDKLEQHIEECKVTKNEFYVFMIDIDDFKNINDTYGHVFGDDVLRKLVTTIQDSVRSHDIVARYGGEEFVILCLEQSKEAVEAVCKRLLHVVSRIEFRNDVRITISIGVSKFYPDDTTTSMIDRADKNMYYIKEHGKNSYKVNGKE